MARLRTVSGAERADVVPDGYSTFQYPVPVDDISIFCKIESDDCSIDVTLTGFFVEG